MLKQTLQIMKVAGIAVMPVFTAFAPTASADPFGSAQQQMNQQIRQWQREDIDKATKPEPQEIIYGGQLMTAQERAEYLAKIRTLKTQAERDEFRVEHQKKIQERARAQSRKQSEGLPKNNTTPTPAPASPAVPATNSNTGY